MFSEKSLEYAIIKILAVLITHAVQGVYRQNFVIGYKGSQVYSHVCVTVCVHMQAKSLCRGEGFFVRDTLRSGASASLHTPACINACCIYTSLSWLTCTSSNSE